MWRAVRKDLSAASTSLTRDRNPKQSAHKKETKHTQQETIFLSQVPLFGGFVSTAVRGASSVGVCSEQTRKTLVLVAHTKSTASKAAERKKELCATTSYSQTSNQNTSMKKNLRASRDNMHKGDRRSRETVCMLAASNTQERIETPYPLRLGRLTQQQQQQQKEKLCVQAN
jgi:hypothetical protein